MGIISSGFTDEISIEQRFINAICLESTGLPGAERSGTKISPKGGLVLEFRYRSWILTGLTHIGIVYIMSNGS
jgi:hypothetical protein